MRLVPCRWLTLAAVAPDPSSPSRQEYMGGFVLSVVADVAEFVAAPVGNGWSLAVWGFAGAGVRWRRAPPCPFTSMRTA